MWGTFISLISRHRCPFIQLTYFHIIIITRSTDFCCCGFEWKLTYCYVIQKCFDITCHKHQISHFKEYRNKSYYRSCNILYPWYPKRQENLIVIWMQMLLMVKTFYKVKSLLPNHMSVVNRFLRFWIEFIYSICIIHNTSKNSLYVLESKWIEMWTILSFIDFSSEWTSP